LYDVVETHVDQDGVASADLERPQGGVVARGRCAAFVVVTRESANKLVLRLTVMSGVTIPKLFAKVTTAIW
jgi:hypothetical protein